MPKFIIPQASYRNGTLHPAGSVVESEIHEATTGSRLAGADNLPVKGVKPLSKAEIEKAHKAFIEAQEEAGVEVASANGISVTAALEEGVDEVGGDDSKPKGKKAKKDADAKLPV